ncbi:NPCBM/NEW2 domain-containing protein [bacterium]|nr:NPCBM/NEW2 domain-containing protein [bacterium]
MKLHWSSRCLTQPGPAPDPLVLVITDVKALRADRRYSLSDGSLTGRSTRNGMTLRPPDRSFTLSLTTRRFPATVHAFSASVGGTEWRHDHATCGPPNAIDGNSGTPWRAGTFHVHDAWLSLRFTQPAEMDEVEVVEAAPMVVKKWRLLGQATPDALPRVLAEGGRLGSLRLPHARGTWHCLLLQLIKSDAPPGIAEIIPRKNGVPILMRTADRVEIDAVFSDGLGEVELVATTNMQRPILCRTHAERSGDRKVLTMTSGFAASPSLSSLYDRERDIALTFDAWNHSVRMVPDEAGYHITSRAASGQRVLGITARPYYYQSALGVRFFRPIDKSTWPVAPTFAMTWYGIRAWEISCQNHDRLDPQIEWVGRHLAPYGLSVFQFDDCYDRRDDKLMRSLSDKVRHEGMIPGIWFTPFSTAFPEHFERRPDWFLHDETGARIHSFTGHTYRDPGMAWEGAALNLSNRGAEEWYRHWWRKVNDVWNFDYFKIDGIPTAIDAYFKAADLDRARFTDPMLGIQCGIEIAREVVGATKFINLCWGMPVDAMGFANGSRTGQDSGGFKHNIRTIVEWQYLNNTAWYCDPDSLSYMHDKTPEHTRLRAQARTLTGQQFSTDETWTLYPEPITRVLQKSIPMIDIYPTQLYRITPDWESYEIFDLKLRRPYGQWDVVGLFNYRDEPRRQSLPLSRLDLAPGRYHVWSFWEHKYLGEFDSQDTVRLPDAKPLEGRAYAVQPTGEGPRLLATDRHTTMGGLDLIEYACTADGDGRWRVSGLSDHLVAGDPYRITLHASRCPASQLNCDNGKMEVEYLAESPGIVELCIIPQTGGKARWSALLEEGKLTLARPAPARVELGVITPGESRSGFIEVYCDVDRIPIIAASANDFWLNLAVAEPFAVGKPYRIPFTVDTRKLAPKSDFVSAVVLETAEGVAPARLEVPVAFRTGAVMPKGRNYEELSKLHDAIVIAHEQGYGRLRINRSVTGAPIILGGKTYATGLGAHAPQRTSYFIAGGGYTHFVAVVGLDATAKSGHGKAAVQFRVELDGRVVLETPEMREDSPPITLVVDELKGARVLTLVCDNLGDQDYDHADWAEARLYK